MCRSHWALLCGLWLSYADFSQAIAACASCPSTNTCVLADTTSTINAGASAISLQMCNFDSSNTGYKFEFSVSIPPACDPQLKTVPTMKAFEVVSSTCTTDACTVNVTLAEPIDWVIAMQSGADTNLLYVNITSSTGLDEVVQIGTSQAITGATLPTEVNATSVSVCTSSFPITGSRFSQVPECNVFALCRGAAGATSCTTSVDQSLLVENVDCDGDSCTGEVTLSTPLPCDGASGDSSALIGSIQVANSAQSNYVQIATMAAASAASISSVSGVETGSSTLLLDTDATCFDTSLALNISQDSNSVSVSSVNNSDGAITVELTTALEDSFSGESLKFSLSQCGVDSTSFETTVDDGNDSASSSGASATHTFNELNNSTTHTTTASGVESTQESNSSTGLSGGLVVGIVIGVVALMGFLFELWHHKRRAAPQPPIAQMQTNRAADHHTV